MVEVNKERFAAKIDGDFVVFLIGMRINRFWAMNKWLPVVMAMPRMLKELAQRPELGMIGARTYLSGRTVMVVQYWRSFEHLHTYAHAKDKEHLPAWAEFNHRVGGNGAVGIFHESYLISAGRYEAVYQNMPRFGLALAGAMVPAVGSMQSARERIKASAAKATGTD